MSVTKSINHLPFTIPDHRHVNFYAIIVALIKMSQNETGYCTKSQMTKIEIVRFEIAEELTSLDMI